MLYVQQKDNRRLEKATEINTLLKERLNMEQIVKMINGVIHTSGCTLSCEYCYLAQANYKNEIGIKKALQYPLDVVRQACSKERLGGTCFIQIIGDGETLLPEDAVDLICAILQEGHYVQVINNGTLTKRIRELVERVEKENVSDHLLMSFSLHFLELEKRNLLDTYADNVNYVREKGISYRVSLVCGDDYIDAAERIHQFCKTNLGGVHLESTRARKDDKTGNAVGVFSKYDKEIYCKKVEKEFPSLNLKQIEEYERLDNHQFCYAGQWYFQVDFTTGTYWQCLRNAGPKYNFFEKLNEKLILEPVGMGCKASFCWCGWAPKLNLIPGKCNYVALDERINAPENKFIEKNILHAGFYDLAKTNEEYTEEEKEESTRKRIELEYFACQVDLLRFDFKEEKYDQFIEQAEKLLETDLNPRLLDVVWLVVRYGYALIRTGKLERALDLESCWDDLEYNADYCYIMGLIYMKSGMIEKAVTAFLEATQKSFVMDKGVNDYLAYFNLGVIYECIGQNDEAKQYYLKCENYEAAKQRLKEMNV